MRERKLVTEQNCNILTPTLLAITAFLSRSPGLLNRWPGSPASLGHVPQSSIFFPTRLIPTWSDSNCNCLIGGLGAHSAGSWLSLPHLVSNWLNFLYTKLYNCSTPTFFFGRHKSHSFNPSTVKVIFWYSSTGCTCYLHWCISYFDSPVGSEVNIQQEVIPQKYVYNSTI